MQIKLLIIFYFIFIGLRLHAQPDYEKILTDLLDQPEYKNAFAGILLSDVSTGEVVFEMNSDKLMIPASVLKLVTSAAALEILGSDYRFQTRIGYSGKIENGTLKGDLIIIGGGDPALGSEYFPNHYFLPHFLDVWAKSVKAAGIRRVEGRLVTDNSFFGKERIPPTWIWEDMGNYYGAASSALSVYDNLFRITFQSPPTAGMPAQIISVSPPIKGLSWHNEVLSSDINRDLAYVFGSPIDTQRIIRGTIPKNRRRFTIKASNPFPENLLAEDFLAYLASSGVFVTGSMAVDNINPDDFQQLTLFESPSLSEIIKILNRESVNLFAEHLVKQVAAEATGKGNREAGLKIISEFWKSKGLNTNQLFMEDGSGLSHFNAVSPQFVSAVLRYMKNSSPNFSSFYESLPAVGMGTINGFSPGLFSENTLRLKSGSMKRIRCFAGYLKTDSGKDYSIIFFMNHFSGSHGKLIAELENFFLKIKNE